jgi:hypothetical protein
MVPGHPQPGSPDPGSPPDIDSSVPHSARIWNFWLGGKDNYPVDQQVGREFLQVYPGIVDVARGVRYFLARAVRQLAGEAGISQFLDIGTGLPTVDNTHEVAQRVNPACRIVYVDNDPLVLVHARALLTSTPEGACDYIDADVRDPEPILAAAAKSLDFSQPVALMLLGILGHVDDYGAARSITSCLMDALPAGSYLAIADGVAGNEQVASAQERYNQHAPVPYHLRRPDQIASFFDGLDLVEPGAVPCPQWKPDSRGASEPSPEPAAYCGVARKP